MDNSPQGVNEDWDIAIVGGGIAGLYCAYRLRQAWLDAPSGSGSSPHEQLRERLGLSKDHQNLRVVLLERDPLRLGGRLRNVELPFPGGGAIVELGAMRFTSRHKLLCRLLTELEVRTEPYADHNFSTQYYLRGKHFTDQDIASGDPERFPYRLDDKEAGRSPGDLVALALDRALHELTLDSEAPPQALIALAKLRGGLSRTTLTPEEWRHIRTYGRLTGTIPLPNIGMWNLIHHYLSLEAALLVEDGFGYDSIIGNWNVSDAIEWFTGDFTPGQSFETIIGGFGSMVEQLRQLLEKPADAPDGRQASEYTVQSAKPGGDDPTTSPDSEHVLRAVPRFTFKIFQNTLIDQVSDEAGKLQLSGFETNASYRVEPNVGFVGPMATDEPAAAKIPQQQDATADKDSRRTFALKASAVILALPKVPLTKIKLPSVPPKDQSLWNHHLERVTPHRLMKIALGFREAWWKDATVPHGATGRIFTDLPLRQIYYFDREWMEKRGRYRFDHAPAQEAPAQQASPTSGCCAPCTKPPEPGIEGVIVAYLDGRRSSFWRPTLALASAHDKAPVSIVKDSQELIENELRERKLLGERIWGWRDMWQVREQETVAKLLDQPVKDWQHADRSKYQYFYRDGLHQRAATKLSQMVCACHHAADHEQRQAIPDPVAGAYAFWYSFGEDNEAGWHTWEPGVSSEKTTYYMSQPFGDTRIHVCGEAYSTEQGWIEGALKSAELALARLGLEPPHGIDRNYVGLANVYDTRPATALFSNFRELPPSSRRTLVFVSGKIGFPPAQVGDPPSFTDQVTNALNTVFSALSGAQAATPNATTSSLVSVRVFLSSMDHYEEFNEIYARACEERGVTPRPARTVIAAAALPFGALVEIDAIGAVE
jgi:enamine deaminase RidA (YjgF/YER057c/UK114 family)